MIRSEQSNPAGIPAPNPKVVQIWGKWEDAEFVSLRENNGTGIRKINLSTMYALIPPMHQNGKMVRLGHCG